MVGALGCIFLACCRGSQPRLVSQRWKLCWGSDSITMLSSLQCLWTLSSIAISLLWLARYVAALSREMVATTLSSLLKCPLLAQIVSFAGATKRWSCIAHALQCRARPPVVGTAVHSYYILYAFICLQYTECTLAHSWDKKIIQLLGH